MAPHPLGTPTPSDRLTCWPDRYWGASGPPSGIEAGGPVSAMTVLTASPGRPDWIGPAVPLSLRISHGPQRNGAVIERTTTTMTTISQGNICARVGPLV